MKFTKSLIIVAALAIPMTALAQEEPTKSQSPEKMEVQHAAVKGHVLPIVAGIESAEMAAVALHELSMTQPLESKDVRKSAELAEHALDIAHDRTESLGKMKELSSEARASAKQAEKELKGAKSTAKDIRREVGAIEGRFRKDQAEKVRSLSMKLHGQLEKAEASMRKFAQAYKIDTELEMRQSSRTQGSK